MKNQFLIFILLFGVLSCKNKTKEYSNQDPEMKKRITIDSMISIEVWNSGSSRIDYEFAHTVYSSGAPTTSTGQHSAATQPHTFIVNLNDEINFFSTSERIPVRLKFKESTIWPSSIKIYLQDANPTNTCSDLQRIHGQFGNVVTTNTRSIENVNNPPENHSLTANIYGRCFTKNSTVTLKYKVTKPSTGRSAFLQLEVKSPTDSDTRIDVVIDDTNLPFTDPEK